MTAQISVAEAISLIKHSSLPTVVTEGRTDYTAFRKIEEQLSDIGVSFLPLTGRDTVLSVWADVLDSGHDNAFFVIDQDSWLYTGMPEKYLKNNIVTTLGYCLENDLFVDADLVELLSNDEKIRFENDLACFSRWYAVEIVKIINGVDSFIGAHPNRIFETGEAPDYLDMSADDRYWSDILVNNYKQLIRGKSLFALIMRQISKRKGDKLSYNNLIEISSYKPSALLDRIAKETRFYFSSLS